MTQIEPIDWFENLSSEPKKQTTDYTKRTYDLELQNLEGD